MDITTSHNETVSERLLSQRVLASGRISAERREGRTRLAALYQEGAAKIRMPRPEGDWLEAVLINTAGGMTGGDRLAWQVEIGEGASAVITTQACEKVYRAAYGHAELSARLAIAVGGRLAWLPQETIVYDSGAFVRRLDVEMADTATALLAETTLFGRGAMESVSCKGASATAGGYASEAGSSTPKIFASRATFRPVWPAPALRAARWRYRLYCWSAGMPRTGLTLSAT